MEDNSFNRDTHTDHSNEAPQGIQLAMQSNAPANPNAAGTPAADPEAHNDTDLASGATATGNVISGVGTTTGSAGADSGPASIQVTGVTPGAATSCTSVPGGGTTVQGVHGTLTINPDGSYTYSANPTACGTDIFTYRIADNQGDRSTASLAISVLGDTA